MKYGELAKKADRLAQSERRTWAGTMYGQMAKSNFGQSGRNEVRLGAGLMYGTGQKEALRGGTHW